MLLRGLAGYLLLVTAVTLLWEQPSALFAALLGLAALTLLVARSRRVGAYLVAGALLGPGGEALAIARGAWAYAHTDGLLIPVWLPVAWGLACVYLVLIVEALLARGARRPDAN